MQNKDPESILQYVRHFRADIFTRELTDMMNAGAEEDLALQLEAMPDIGETGYDNYLDLFAIRTRLPNYYAHEQARLDECVPNFMPYAQQDFINAVMSIPVTARRSGRLYKNIIRGNAHSLWKYPLVKGDVTYPFSLSPAAAYAWCVAKRKLKPAIENKVQHDFLHALQEYVDDSVNSGEFHRIDGIDSEKVKRLTRDYYGGDLTKASELDWFLSFYFWYGGLVAAK